MNTAGDSAEPLPVEAGVWVVVIGELCVFTLFFATFLYYRALSPELFEASSAALRGDLGALNTMILLASSWCVASAVNALGSISGRRWTVPYLAGAIACGVAFVAVKVVEYRAAIGSGVNVLTDDFFMFYFMLTGIHLLHLLFGLVLLVAAARHLRDALAVNGAINDELVGFSGCFWHMIDIVWIVLFPLLYLLH
jgi:nitric oxide reductase NorE protein